MANANERKDTMAQELTEKIRELVKNDLVGFAEEIKDCTFVFTLPAGKKFRVAVEELA